MMSSAVRHDSSSRISASLPLATRWRRIAISGTIARAAADQQQRPADGRIPGEVAADRPAQLELVAGAQLVDQVGRDLAVVQPLDRQRERAVLGRGRDRVAALRLVAVLGGQPDVDVLAGAVPGQSGRAERERLDPRRLVDRADDVGELPAQSPA